MTKPASDFAERRAAMIAAGYWRDETLLDHLARHVACRPDKAAVIGYRAGTGQPRTLSYAELDAISTRMACAFRQLGVGKGDVVSMQLPNWWQGLAVHLAALKIGAITNPLMPILRERELGYMLKQARTKVFVVPQVFRNFDYVAMARGLQDQLPDLVCIADVDEEGADGFTALLETVPADAALPADVSPVTPDDAMEILFTSGTTGQPKGVMHSSNTMLANLVPFAQRLGLTGEDVFHMPSPIGHQLGFMYGMVLPTMLGATTVLQDLFDPAEMALQIERHAVSFTMAAPPFLADFVAEVEKSGASTQSLKIFVSAGAPVARSLVAKSREVLGAAVISGWGMSENGAVTITGPDDSIDNVTNTDGYVLDGVEIVVRREDDSIANPDETGRLFVRACSNFLGYFARPDLVTLDSEGWFDTGDYARIDAKGYVRITGRSKDTIIRGGENIPVVEVEDLILQHPAIRAVSIVAVPHERLGEQAFAFVVLENAASFDLAAMREHLRRSGTAAQYFPEYLKVIDVLPTTASGKVQKFVLRDVATAELGR